MFIFSILLSSSRISGLQLFIYFLTNEYKTKALYVIRKSSLRRFEFHLFKYIFNIKPISGSSLKKFLKLHKEKKIQFMPFVFHFDFNYVHRSYCFIRMCCLRGGRTPCGTNSTNEQAISPTVEDERVRTHDYSSSERVPAVCGPPSKPNFLEPR